jgi:quercetin dioxygenase-like cupin family protein
MNLAGAPAFDLPGTLGLTGNMSILIGPNDGEVLGGDFAQIIKVRSAMTHGVMSVLEETIPPRRLIPPHAHRNDVWCYVLSGEIGVLVGEEIVHAGPGAWVLKPRDVVHAMCNRGDVGARIIEVLTPGGSEAWFEEILSLAQGDSAGFDAACARHGLVFHRDSPWTAKLRQRFHLK